MKSILIVEDDDAIRIGLCRSLSSDTLDTVGVGNLMSARQRLDAERYDLLLLDCNLPDGNGIDFCRELMKKIPIPVIFLTVRDSEIDEVAAFHAGACDYVKKPFSLMVLRERIAALLERAEKRSDLYVDRRYRFDFASLDFPENSKITVMAQRYETYVRLDILDEGPGIPEEELSEIWKRFYRGKTNRNASGVGIGLTLCRMIVQAQGGRVLCQNREDRGCRFSIFLPTE